MRTFHRIVTRLTLYGACGAAGVVWHDSRATAVGITLLAMGLLSLVQWMEEA